MGFDLVGPLRHKENDGHGNRDRDDGHGNGDRFEKSDFPPVFSSTPTASLSSFTMPVWQPTPSSSGSSVWTSLQSESLTSIPFSQPTTIISAPFSSPTKDPTSINWLPPQTTLEASLPPSAASTALSSPSAIAVSASPTNTGLPTGALVGISVGAAVGAIAITAALAVFWMRRRNNSKGVYAPATDKSNITGFAKRTTGGSLAEMGEVSSMFDVPSRDSGGSYGYGEGIIPLPAYTFVNDSQRRLTEGHENDDEEGRGIGHTRGGQESASLLNESPRIPDRSPLRSPALSPPQPAMVYPTEEHSEHALRTSYIAALEAEAEAELGHSSTYSHRAVSGMPSRNFGTVGSMSTVSSMGETEVHEGRDLMAMGSQRHRPVSPIEEN